MTQWMYAGIGLVAAGSPVDDGPMRSVPTPITLLIAAVLVGIAALVGTDQWANFFHHPARQPLPEETRQGAMMWRAMLVVMAVALVVFPLVFRGLVAVGTNGLADRATNEGVLSRKRMGVLVGILAIALILRCTRLGESLWYDEIASWLSYGVNVNSPGPIVGNYFDPVNHVFHTLLSWISVKTLASVVGDDLALRLPALLFSMLGVLAMFGLGRAAANDRVGLLAAFLSAIVPVSVLEGVEARGYSMMICFAALSTTLLWKLRQRPSLIIAVGYALCCALGIWSQFVTAFVPIGHGLWLLWRAIRHREWATFRVCFSILVFAAIITVTLYSPLIPDMLNAKGMFFSSRGDEPTILGAEGRHALMQLGGSWYWWAAAPGLALGLIGLVTLRHREPASGVVALSLTGLPLMVLIVVITGSWIYARFTFFALPGGLLLMALGIDQLWNWRREAGVIAITIMLGASIGDLMIRPSKQPLRDAALYVSDHHQPLDQVLAIGLAHEVLGAYAGDLDLTYSLLGGRDLHRQLPAIRPAWIIIEYPNTVTDTAWKLLSEAGYREVTRFPGWVDWTNGDVIVLKRTDN